jgi:hypothetical protein
MFAAQAMLAGGRDRGNDIYAPGKISPHQVAATGLIFVNAASF